MKLSEYIVMLQDFLKENEDIEVAFTESGYYSSGPIAELYCPPEVEKIDVSPTYKTKDIRKFIVLGHSHQNY